jgi:Coenzyme PQQ synthesis protein D (PqqD)
MPDLTPVAVRPTRHVIATATQEGVMLLDLRGRGRWFTLPPSAGIWWQHLAAGNTSTAAADTVAAHYGIDRTKVRNDITALVRDLLDHGLVEPTATPARRRWRRRPW